MLGIAIFTLSQLKPGIDLSIEFLYMRVLFSVYEFLSLICIKAVTKGGAAECNAGNRPLPHRREGLG
jgi:hypothetical protein